MLAAAPAAALDPSVPINQSIVEHWQSRDGLPQNSVNGIAQTANGYLWLATFDGLVRFDGQRFERMSDDSLPGRRLRIIAGDDEGFWISGQFGGLTRHDGEHPVPVPVESWGIERSITHVSHSRAGLWIAAEDGLYLVGPEDNIRHFGRDDGLPAEPPWNVIELADGQIYAGTTGFLARAHLDDLDAGFSPVSGEHLEDTVIYDVQSDGGGGIWVASHKGLSHVDRGGRARSVDLPVGAGRETSPRRLLLDDHGALWVGMWNDGLYRLTDAGREHIGRSDGLYNLRFTALFKDREGSLWFGTDGGGLGRLRDRRVTSYGSDWDEFSMHSVNAVLESTDGGLWMGVGCEGLVRFRDGIEAVYQEPDGFANTCIASLMRDGQQRLWAGTRGDHGVYRRRGDRFEPVELPRWNLPVMALFEQSSGRIWAGTSEGLLAYDARTDAFDEVPGTGDWYIQFLAEDAQGRLWVATRDGVRVGSPADGFDSIGEGAIGHVRAIHHDARGVVWIGTYGEGLFRWEDGDLFAFGTEHGLPESVISRIIPDDDGHFWLTGNQGIHGVVAEDLDAVAEGRADRLRVVSLGASDGMRTPETNGGIQPAGIRDREGRIWVPTVDGLATFHPERIRRNTVPPPVVIEHVAIDGKTVAHDAEVVVPPGSQSVEVHYAGLSFLVPEQVRFRYRLGEDGDWIDADSRRTAYFSSLPPGRHRFEVMAANNDGVWSEQPAAIEIRARATFTQTVWFPVVLGSGGAGLIALLAGTWIIQARRRAIRLTRMVRERTRELEIVNQKLEKLARIDELTGLSNRRAFEETLKREWGRARRDSTPLSLIVVDIDHFKQYNDLYGHVAGDLCLRRVSRTLADCLQRDDDFLARYGGEEFVAILPSTRSVGARLLADRMLRQVARLTIEHGNSDAESHVTISAGTATARPSERDKDPMELIRRADQALYAAKRSGRNTVQAAP